MAQVENEVKQEENEVKLPTFLPCFSGFYNTLWESDDESLTDNDGNSLEYELDYEKYEEDVCKAVCETLPEFVKLDGNFKLGFEKMVRPKEYNFVNDSADIVAVVDQAFLDSFKQWIEEHEGIVDDYLCNRYSSRDGFIPFFSTDIHVWKEDTENWTKWSGETKDEHRFGSMLECYLYSTHGDDFEFEVLYHRAIEFICLYDYIKGSTQ